MEYKRSVKYERPYGMIMGPNPLKLAEELLENRGWVRIWSYVTWVRVRD